MGKNWPFHDCWRNIFPLEWGCTQWQYYIRIKEEETPIRGVDIPEIEVVKIIALGEVMIFAPFGIEVTRFFSTQKEKR
jgi:hypothetical protein